jgi:hypothetical protein
MKLNTRPRPTSPYWPFIVCFFAAILVGVPGYVQADTYIYWTDTATQKVQRANLDGSNVQDILSGLPNYSDLAVDSINEKVYWTNGNIQRANLDGTGVEEIVPNQGAVVFIALDVANNHIYWTIASDPGTVARANLDGSNIQTLITDRNDIKYPQFIALDLQNNKLFYRANTPNNTDYIIRRANLDGTTIENFITGQFNNGLEGIAIDTSGAKIYWAGRDSKNIYRQNLDGTNQQVIVSGLNDPRDVVVDAVNGKVYWCDIGAQKIQRANLDGSSIEDVVTSVTSPYALTIATIDEGPDSIFVSIPDTAATYGTTIPVPVRLSDTTNLNVVSAELFISFDSSLLTIFSVGTNNTLLSANWSVESNIVAGNGTDIDTLKIAAATDNDALGGAGTLLDINFQVADIRVPIFSSLKLEHVLFNDGTPPHAATDGSLTVVGTDAAGSTDVSNIVPGESITATIIDADENLDDNALDSFVISVANGAQTESMTLTETGNATGEFTGTISTTLSLGASSGDGVVQAKPGDQIVFTYTDQLLSDGSGSTALNLPVDVLGGGDGNVAITLVSQPGDPLYIEVLDADLNASFSTAETVSVTVENSRTTEVFTVVLMEADIDDEVFFGSLPTVPGVSTATAMNTAEDDIVTVTYNDNLTAQGGTNDIAALSEVIDPWGEADDNESLQAFDAAQVLIDVLSSGTHLAHIGRISANVDIDPVTSGITPFDASLVLQKRVGLISSFPVQDPTSTNHPQGDPASPKRITEQRVLSLVVGDGYLSVVADERADILSGDLLLRGVEGSVEMGAEWSSFLSASRTTDEGLRIVFAGAEAVHGPGEIVRIYPGVGPDMATLARVQLNDGRIEAQYGRELLLSIPQAYQLHANMPNPFNPSTQIRFDLPAAGLVELTVYDMLGQKVRALVTAPYGVGSHQVEWNGRNDAGLQVGSGMYFYRIEAGAFVKTQRMLLLK